MPRLVGAGRVQEHGVDQRPIHLLVEAVQIADRVQQEVGLVRLQRGNLAAERLLERLGLAPCRLQVLREPRIVDAGIQVPEVPGNAVGATVRRIRHFFSSVFRSSVKRRDHGPPIR